MQPDIIIVAGPTASGKSQVALALAQRLNGVIVNADSLQVYQACPILTAQPTPQDMASCPHELYHVIAPDHNFSVADWMDSLNSILSKKPLIFVGGTGFYFSTLVHGISHIPTVSLEIRQEAEALFTSLGPEDFFTKLTCIDPALASRLHPNDKQRVVRGYSVWLASGKPLSFWQQHKGCSPLEGRTICSLHLDLPLPVLHERAERRFSKMIASGAIEEVESLLKMYDLYQLSPTLAKAIGLKPIADFLRGSISKQAMLETSLIQTRQYIKRQRTWFRNQPLPHTMRLEDSHPDPILSSLCTAQP